VNLRVQASQGVLRADTSQTVYLKIGLEGQSVVKRSTRAPINVAIVLDRSGSMSGEKLRQAKEAAIAAIERLNARDIVSVVAYDDVVRVLVPATKVSDKRQIYRAIRRLDAGSMTALFAGVSKGSSEVRKFRSRERVNRVVLLSDGLANIGPSSPDALGALGLSLLKEGISVTTIGLGLGYNEDLMYKLASASDGNHVFVEHPKQLASIFDREFNELMSVVAKDVYVTVDCPPQVRPVRAWGREASITAVRDDSDGQLRYRVRARLNQIYGGQQKYLLLAVKVPPHAAGTKLGLGQVRVHFADTATNARRQLADMATVSFSDSHDAVTASENREVMVAVTEQQATDDTERAVVLRDQGRIKEAKKVMKDAAALLRTKGTSLGSSRLNKLADEAEADEKNLSPEDWRAQRKRVFDRSAAVRGQVRRQ
jgi:Ca-activated chloride channel family protein